MATTMEDTWADHKKKQAAAVEQRKRDQALLARKPEFEKQFADANKRLDAIRVKVQAGTLTAAAFDGPQHELSVASQMLANIRAACNRLRDGCLDENLRAEFVRQCGHKEIARSRKAAITDKLDRLLLTQTRLREHEEAERQSWLMKLVKDDSPELVETRRKLAAVAKEIEETQAELAEVEAQRLRDDAALEELRQMMILA